MQKKAKKKKKVSIQRKIRMSEKFTTAREALIDLKIGGNVI